MNTSGAVAAETPVCFSVNSPPFNYTHSIASAYFSATFSGLGLSSNLFALAVLVKSYRRTKSRSRSSFLVFLLGLVLTDFMGLLVTGSIVVSFHLTHFNWRRLDPHCHFCNFMGASMVFYGLCPLLLGAAMAVERFVGINRPFARSADVPKRRAWTAVGSVWAAAGCVGMLPVLGLGAYHVQMPGSWCFFLIGSRPLDMTFSLLFSLTGLTSLGVSFVLNTVSVVTLLRVCCGRDAAARRRDHEVEMMVQLIGIMIIASICWCPLLMFILRTVVLAEATDPDYLLFFLRLATCNQICDPWVYILCQESRLRRVFIAETVLSGARFRVRYLLLWLRFATWNQILDPWVYILFRRSVLKRVYPRLDLSRGSIMTLYPSFAASLRRLTHSSLGGGAGKSDDGGATLGMVDAGPSHRPPKPRPLEELSTGGTVKACRS